MKPIIVVEYGEKYQYDKISEMVESFLGTDFYRLSEEEKINRIRLKTYMNAGIKNSPIKDLTKGEKIEELEKEQYIICDEETLLLSLAKNNDIVIYENENNPQFAKGINKERLEKIAEHYIRVNDCANEILKNKLGLDKIIQKNSREKLLKQEIETLKKVEQEKYQIDFEKNNHDTKLEKKEEKEIINIEEKWYKKLISKILRIFKIVE